MGNLLGWLALPVGSAKCQVDWSDDLIYLDKHK